MSNASLLSVARKPLRFSSLRPSWSYCSRSWCLPLVSRWSLWSRSRQSRSRGTAGGTARGSYNDAACPRSTRASHCSRHFSTRASTVDSGIATGRSTRPTRSLRQPSPSAGSNWAGASSVNTATSFARRCSTTPSASRAAAVRNQVGERHRTSRAVFTRAFAPSTVEAARPAMEAAVRRHLATWLAESADFASPESPIRSRLKLLVLDAWITVFLGVDPRTDVHVARAPRLSSSRATASSSLNGATHTTWPSSSRSFVSDRCIPTSCLRALLRTLAERAPEALDDPVVTSNLVHLLDISRHDVAGLLTWLVYRLAHDRQWCDRIRQAGADDQPASWVVSETIRLSQSENVFRETQCPVMIEGYTIPAGWWLRVLVREGHRDADVFADPERFDPCRFVRGMPPGPNIPRSASTRTPASVRRSRGCLRLSWPAS